MPFNQLLTYGEHRVCAACRHTVVQKFEQGLPLGNASTTAWRKKRHAVLRTDALILPCRCIQCNEPTPNTDEAKLEYLTPTSRVILLLSLLLGVLPVAIVYIILRKSKTVTYSMCQTHKDKRNFKKKIAIGSSLAGVCVFPLILAELIPPFFVMIGVLFLITGLVFALISRRKLFVKDADDTTVTLGGLNKSFLQSLPEWVE